MTTLPETLADPAGVVSFTYESIAGDKRVPIKARILTERQSAEHGRMYEEIISLDSGSDQAVHLRDQMIRLGIVSPGLDVLASELSRRDMYELALRYPVVLDELEIDLLGKSISRRRFITARPAEDAAVPPASTPQASPATDPAPPVQSS